MSNWLVHTVPLSLNRHLVDKEPPKNGQHRGNGFESFDLTAPQLAEAVKLGNAQTAQFRGGTKRAANFIRSGAIFLDFDSGLSLETIKHLPFVAAHGTLLYTTASHTLESPRCRVVAFLTSPIVERTLFATLVRFALTVCFRRMT